MEKELCAPDSTSSVDKEDITRRMIINCQELILNYPQIATQKNIDNILWKHCYYRNIEAYRKKIRQLSTILEKPYTRTPANDAQFHEYRQNLMKVSSILNQYLSQSAAFYESLLMQLEHLIERKVTTREATSDVSVHNDLTTDIDAYLKSVYFCLLYLGDIARLSEYFFSDLIFCCLDMLNYIVFPINPKIGVLPVNIIYVPVKFYHL